VLWYYGLIESYIFWTYRVPLFEFPSSTEYTNRLYTKLAWFTGLCLSTLVASAFRRDWAAEVLSNRYLTHLLIGGVCAAFPLVKSQAPHYLFPMAAFVLLPITAFWSMALARTSMILRGWMYLVVSSLVLLMLASVIAYKPKAVARLFELANWSNEAERGRRIQSLVPPNAPILLLTQDNIFYITTLEDTRIFPCFTKTFRRKSILTIIQTH